MADTFRSSYSMVENSSSTKPAKGRSLLRGFLFGRSKTLNERPSIQHEGLECRGSSGILTANQYDSGYRPLTNASRSRSAVFVSSHSVDSSQPLISTKSLDSEKTGNAPGKAFRARYRSSKKSAAGREESGPSPTVSVLESDSLRKLRDIGVSGKIKTAAFVPQAASTKPQDAATRPNESDSHDYVSEGDKAFKKGLFDQAIVEYTLAIERNSLDSDVWSKRSSAHYKLSCISLAMKDAWKAIELNSSSPHPYYQLGLIYKSMGDNAAAVRFIRTALELETSPPPSLVALTLNAESALSRKARRQQAAPSANVVSKSGPLSGSCEQDIYISAANQYPALAY